MHDMAGHVIVPAGPMPTNDPCGHFAAHTQTPGTPLCARRSIDVPVSIGPIVYAVIGGMLIISGVLTFYERGPGRWIRPSPRRRGATQRARRWRRRIGGGMAVLGCFCLLRAFG